MDTSFKKNKLNLFESLFKFLFIIFWVIFWFIGVILTDHKFDNLIIYIFLIYTFICITYIFSYLIYMKFKNEFEVKIEIFYKILTLLSFIFATLSYYILPLNVTFFFIKIILLFIYMYISILKVYKYKLEEGVVGIISSTLLIFMFLRY